MYVPASFAASDEVVRDLLTHLGAADLVTATSEGLLATFLPLLYDPTVGEHGALLGHVARNKRSVAAGGDRRGNDCRPRPGLLYLSVLVRRQG